MFIINRKTRDVNWNTIFWKRTQLLILQDWQQGIGANHGTKCWQRFKATDCYPVSEKQNTKFSQVCFNTVSFFLIFWFCWDWFSSWTVLLPLLFGHIQEPRWNLTAWSSHHISYVSQIWNIMFRVESNSFTNPPCSARPTYPINQESLAALVFYLSTKTQSL